MAEVNVMGVYTRYILPYDGKARRYIAEYERREEREEKSDRLPQYFADALYELAAKYEVEITAALRLIRRCATRGAPLRTAPRP